MSLENEDRSSPCKATEPSSQTQKQSKISYTRDFLLSLSVLEICKKLPTGIDNGIDKSILSEFEDTSYGNQDRQRIQGTLPSQSFRRNEYSSSPPTRGESGNFSRGIYRWDSRSSARSDRDSDSQSDRDSDSGRRYGNQSRRSWQGPEHDGLLGSGSFPRPSGYAAGMSKVQTNDTCQLNRSNEPYHPPRPYKAIPLSRRDAHDSYNDETFGSTESMSEDRMEEEKRRRASFELMRKEQQKALQEKQKMNMEKNKTDSVSDISIRLDDNKGEKKVLDGNNEVDLAAGVSVSSIDSGKSVLPSQTPTFRPLVPPGFTYMAQEKNSALKSLVHSHPAGVGRSEIQDCLLLAPAQNDALGGTQKSSSEETSISDQQLDSKVMHIPVSNNGDPIANSSLKSDSPSKKVACEELLHQTSVLPEVHGSSDKPENIDIDSKVAGLKLGDEFNENDSTSILEKIFGNSFTVSVSNSMDPIEQHDNKDEAWSPTTVHSSKFARWFVEEERKSGDEHFLSRPNDLLSLIVGSDKSKSHVLDTYGSDQLQTQFPHQSSELANQSAASIPSTNGVSESLQNTSKQDMVQNILRCEDLEQSILSEYSETSSNLQLPLGGINSTSAKSEGLRAPVDDKASQHLLSLLQKGTSHEFTTQKIHGDIDTSEISPASDVYNVGTSLYKTSEEDAKNIQNSGKSLTLETLFGTAFMKELQSVEAPVSVQRGSVGYGHSDDALEPQGLAFPVKDNGLFPSAVAHVGSENTANTQNFLASDSRQQMMLDKTQKWLGNDDPQVDFNLSKNHPVEASKHGGFEVAVDYQLPEEESLIAVNNDLDPQLSKFVASANSRQSESLSSNASGDIAEKLAAIGAAIRVERSTLGSDVTPFVRGPYNQLERDIHYHDFHSQQMGHSRPLLQSDPHPAHMSSQLKFIGPERMIQQDVSGNQHFPTNVLQPPFHHASVGVAGVELPGHRSVLQQMQMSGNYPRRIVNDFPRGTSGPHLGTQTAGFVQEPNPVPGYPFGLRQPNIGGLGMPIPASDTNGGANHPGAFQRLVDMERRANSKQMPPFAGHSQGQGMYGHELDLMRFR